MPLIPLTRFGCPSVALSSQDQRKELLCRRQDHSADGHYDRHERSECRDNPMGVLVDSGHMPAPDIL
jgi:hypothetical protein